MAKKILHTQANGNTQYQFYRTSIIYPGYYNNYKDTEVNEDVRFDAYGIAIVIFMGHEQIHYDSGPLSPWNYVVNALYHRLYRLGLADVNEVRRIIWSEHSTWCQNKYGNTWSKKANQVLRKKIKNR